MVTTTRPKVKSRSHHDIAHLQSPTDVRTKYLLPTSDSFQDIAWSRFYSSRALWQGQSQTKVTT